MKIIPVLVITNALALGLAIVLFVQQGELKSQGGTRRSDASEVPRLEARIASLERELGQASAIREIEAAPAGETASRMAPTGGSEEGPAAGRETPLGAPASGGAAAEPDAPSDDYDSKEMDVFRRKVRKALELNSEEDQKVRIFDRIDELVKQNKIAPLNAKEKEGVASTVLAYRRKIPEVWRKIAADGAMEGVSREERGRIVRVEYEALRVEAQRALEDFMPAVDAKTYLDETMRDQMRGGFGGFGGGPPVQAPAPPSPSR
jgi:hypothetical protein